MFDVDQIRALLDLARNFGTALPEIELSGARVLFIGPDGYPFSIFLGYVEQALPNSETSGFSGDIEAGDVVVFPDTESYDFTVHFTNPRCLNVMQAATPPIAQDPKADPT